MLRIPTTLPILYGSYALLKPLSDEGEQSVYLLAINGATEPWVIKKRPLQAGKTLGPRVAKDDAAKADAKVLARMTSPNLAKVLVCTEVEGEVGVVMENVVGKSLGAIRDQAAKQSLPLPPELGAVVAHDVFAAVDYFHDFEGASRVHGNVSQRTIMVGYSGDAKVAGYRLGFHPRAEIDIRVAKDILPLAGILRDLPFPTFPPELSKVVPCLLEEGTSPAEAVAAAKGFLLDYTPSDGDRRKVATWLEGIFPGVRDRESQESQQLLASGIKLILQASLDKRGWAQNPTVGDEIGEYKILKVLGEGGMGRVYEAEHLETADHVALKVLHPRGRTREIEERFRREAESISLIANPHVVDIVRFGPSGDGKFLYLAMELLQGESLDRILFKEGPFAPLRALTIASQICQALAAAHEAGVIHRDLKPGNVMLVNQGGNPDFVKILDFGLARLDVGESALTRVGDLIGTFAYMAPEQGQGKTATPKIDIYAVGEVLYELLTKKLPHEGAEEILARKATLDATPISHHRPDLTPAICQLVMKCLARDPEERHATMAALGLEIDKIVAKLSAPPAVFHRTWFKVVLTGTTAALLLVGGSVLLVPNRRGQAVSEGRPNIQAPEIRPVHSNSIPDVQPKPSPPDADVAGPVQRVPPVDVSASPSPPRSARPGKHSSTERTNEPSADSLLLDAERAFEAGNSIEAIQLGRQALEIGGGLRAHLSLGKYYQSRRRYREAMDHYRAAIQLDPGNSRAATGIEIVEKKLTPP